MPILEYFCKKCGRRFEQLLRKTNEKVNCPYCQAGDLKRLISTFSFGVRDSTSNFKSSSKCSSCTSGNCSSCA